MVPIHYFSVFRIHILPHSDRPGVGVAIRGCRNVGLAFTGKLWLGIEPSKPNQFLKYIYTHLPLQMHFTSEQHAYDICSLFCDTFSSS